MGFSERYVSTHSRPKAAATALYTRLDMALFQHTAARRRLPLKKCIDEFNKQVSTHSRPKAAASLRDTFYRIGDVSTHSRPKAAA